MFYISLTIRTEELIGSELNGMVEKYGQMPNLEKVQAFIFLYPFQMIYRASNFFQSGKV